MKTYGKVYTTRQEKIGDFIIGYFGCLILNGLYGALVWGLTAALAGSTTVNDSLVSVISIVAFLLPLVLNTTALLFFVFTRVWIALGILAVFATAFVIAICASLVFATVCFGALLTYR